MLGYLINEALNPGRRCIDIHRHLITLFAFIVSMNAKNVLELGVRTGCTTLPMLLGVEATDGVLTSVDIENHTFKCPEELSKYWKFIKSDSLKYLSSLSKNIVFDVVLIDDWHACTHVKRELELLEEHVLKSSIVLLHDLMAETNPDYSVNHLYKNQEQWADGGPYRAVTELDSKKWEFATIPVSNGLTILRKLI